MSQQTYVCVCVSFQNMLNNLILVNGLAPADRPVLGVLKVWGAGNTTITAASLSRAVGEHQLTPQHNLETQVSPDQTFRLFSLQMQKQLFPITETSVLISSC